jgi:threonine dehydratase
VEAPAISAPSLDQIRAARERIADLIVRTPLLRMHIEDAPADIYLKLESLQPIGSFKLRGASNAMALTDPDELARGVWTASAGNMAQGVAWGARRFGVPCSVVVPETAPHTKLDAIERLGGRVVKTSVADWFEVFRTREFPGMHGLFVHAFSDTAVMAGNGTIGLEILEDLPEVRSVVVPFGGGGLSCGIAAALRALEPEARVFASEVAGAAPLAASLAAGHAVEIDYTPSFVDGIGGPWVSSEMWELANRLLAGSLTVSLDQVADAVRLLATRGRLVAEGAGASSLAAALDGGAEPGPIVCIVSGGNIDAATLARILRGDVP